MKAPANVPKRQPHCSLPSPTIGTLESVMVSRPERQTEPRACRPVYSPLTKGRSSYNEILVPVEAATRGLSRIDIGARPILLRRILCATRYIKQVKPHVKKSSHRAGFSRTRVSIKTSSRISSISKLIFHCPSFEKKQTGARPAFSIYLGKPEALDIVRSP
jgi:hypothetical protein